MANHLERSSFSADLKLFVGNLSFNVDSAQLAQLFESAGNVEMVEVIYDKTTDPYAGPPPPKREESFSRGPRSGGYGSERSSYGRSGYGFERSSYGSGSARKYVVEARVIYDSDTGRSKGFGFVTLGSPQEDLDGRQIRVSEAEPRPPRRQL
ncbi:hypothetical protein BRARA_D00529 [Brassica rapa]|uniref:RRM domain-containing protein n=1 Tax=Brassica campestris TaxID=3711 RepID=A0A397ZJZ4_BRACM|nr:hypothetical protein BRARA_D00529 [Brassica rapa]